MNTRTNLTVACVGLALAFLISTPSARANLLVDPGFEANPLTTASNVLNFFATYQGQWGPEMATITGVDGGVTPPQGVKMLRMTDDGQTATQAFQATDVTAYAGIIDSGGATVSLSALFDASPNLSAALGGVYVSFFTASNYGSLTGYIGNTLTLDNSPATWEAISVGGAIPPGTRWLVAQVAYSDATLLGSDGASYPGYVDAADLRVVPEPATLSLLAMGGLAMLKLKRKS